MQWYKRKVFWLDHFFCYIINGSKGSGKSTLVEYILCWFWMHSFLIFDFWAAGNYENAFWVVPGKADPKRKQDPTARSIGYPVLIIHPETTLITQNEPLCTCGKGERLHYYRRPSCLGFEPFKESHGRSTLGAARRVNRIFLLTIGI